MRGTMLAVVKPEAAPGAEIREVKIPAFGRTDCPMLFIRILPSFCFSSSFLLRAI